MKRADNREYIIIANDQKYQCIYYVYYNDEYNHVDNNNYIFIYI